MLKEDIHNTGAREEPSEILQLLLALTPIAMKRFKRLVIMQINACLSNDLDPL